MSYDYRFTNPAERCETKNWWSGELLVLYCPPVTAERASGYRLRSAQLDPSRHDGLLPFCPHYAAFP